MLWRSFFLLTYDRSNLISSIEEGRLDFAFKNKSYGSIPSKLKLIEHKMRLVYQAECTLGEAAICNVNKKSRWLGLKEKMMWMII